jgi:uncharacterized protein YukE
VAIELPSEVVDFLQLIGVNWPMVNEDKIGELATHVREFADSLHGTHQDATAAVHTMSEAYQGASYDALLAKWSSLSDSHMTDMITACHVVADALEVAVGVIVGLKMAAIAELAALAVSFVADQAAAVVTLGIAEAAEALIVLAAEKAVDYLEMEAENYIIAQVIEAALTPLAGVVAQAVGGLVYKATEDALGVQGTPTGSVGGTGFSINPGMLGTHAQIMHAHAETVAGHAQVLQGRLAGLSFE